MVNPNRGRVKLDFTIPETLIASEPPHPVAIVHRPGVEPAWLAWEGQFIAVTAEGSRDSVVERKVIAALNALDVPYEHPPHFDALEKQVAAKMLRDWRKRHGYTQDQAAKVLRASKPTIQRWERGECPFAAVLMRSLPEKEADHSSTLTTTIGLSSKVHPLGR